MLAFEHRVVAALTARETEPVRSGVEEFVSASLAAMPQHLRLGVAGASVAIGTATRVLPAGRARDDARLVGWLERNPLPPVRQYFRLLRSLVIFAAEETRGPGQ